LFIESQTLVVVVSKALRKPKASAVMPNADIRLECLHLEDECSAENNTQEDDIFSE
jgi:hypothetical protein